MSYLLFLQNIRLASEGVLDAFMLKTTELAQGFFTFMLLAFIYWCVDKRIGQLIAFNTSFACWLNQWTKMLFKVERPWVRDPLITPVEEALPGAGGYSFPSGHVARATATYGPIGAAGLRADKPKEHETVPSGLTARKVLGILAWCLIGGIAFSRNYLGVHTFVDVAVSLIAGVVIMFAMDFLLRWCDADGGGYKRDILVWAVSCVVLFLPMLKFGCLSNAGASYGLITGWLLERRFVHSKTDGRFSERVLRFVIGAGVLFFLYTSGTSVTASIVPSKYASFFLQGFAAFFIMFIWPLIFNVWESADIAEDIRKKYKKWICVVLTVVLVLLAVVAGYKMARNLKGAHEHEASLSGDISGAEAMLGESGFIPVYADNIPTRAYENDITVIAHRGYSGVAPENTLASFRRAMDIGADMIELDVQLTSDGEIVIFHDNDLVRVTGAEGRIGDYTYEELHAIYDQLPLLSEALELITMSDLDVYLELKDISDVDSLSEDKRSAFPGMVYDAVTAAGMQDRVVYACFNYDYISEIKETHPEARILCNTSEPDAGVLLRDCPSDFYGVNFSVLTANMVDTLHEAGATVYTWTVNSSSDARTAVDCGVDGIVTNYPGMTKVAVHDEYSFVSDNCIRTITMPGLYDYGVQSLYASYVPQGLTVAGRDRIIVSAYDKSGAGNSILYVMDYEGNLLNVVDLGFQAHTGGIAYDAANSLLWVTHADGHVCALSYSELMDGSYTGGLRAYFDAGLYNDDGGHVASFLTVDDGKLYVGSYCTGNGELHEYEIDKILNDLTEPDAVYEIPEHIQGITFDKDPSDGHLRLLLSQGHEMDDSALLVFDMDDDGSTYTSPAITYVLPEGVEQIQTTPDGLYILFESSARPYRATSRIPNDQIWCLEYKC